MTGKFKKVMCEWKKAVAVLAIWVVSSSGVGAQSYPVEPEVFISGKFKAAEGIAFNGEGRLFITADRQFWEVDAGGSLRKVADLDSHLGVAAFGEKDLLVADFGPTNAFQHQKNHDGIVWRISPDGTKEPYIEGIGDPNFVVVSKDGSVLVSDDASNEIFIYDETNGLRLFSTAVNHPNGLAFSSDERHLYVAQIFSSIRPVIPDDRLWRIDLEEMKPLRRPAVEVARVGPRSANDGLAMDLDGRVYIAANGLAGEIWRYDPKLASVELIAVGMPGIASLAFGCGDFDRNSLYATATYAGGKGGKIYRVKVDTVGICPSGH